MESSCINQKAEATDMEISSPVPNKAILKEEQGTKSIQPDVP